MAVIPLTELSVIVSFVLFKFLGMREETAMAIGCVMYALDKYALNNSVSEAFQPLWEHIPFVFYSGAWT